MKVRFLETYTVQALNGRTFVSGEVCDLEEASAQHFLKKNRCEVYVEPKVDTKSVESGLLDLATEEQSEDLVKEESPKKSSAYRRKMLQRGDIE